MAAAKLGGLLRFEVLGDLLMLLPHQLADGPWPATLTHPLCTAVRHALATRRVARMLLPPVRTRLKPY
jgi:hypothetical protein